MADEERKDVMIGVPAADAGDAGTVDPVPPADPEPADDDGE